MNSSHQGKPGEEKRHPSPVSKEEQEEYEDQRAEERTLHVKAQDLGLRKGNRMSTREEDLDPLAPIGAKGQEGLFDCLR